MRTAQLVHVKALHMWVWVLVQQVAALVATHSGLKSSCLKFYVISAAGHVCMFTVGKRTTNRKWVEEINEPSVGAL